jgi:hypothetical protein
MRTELIGRRNPVTYIIAALLFIGFSILPSEKIFSQQDTAVKSTNTKNEKADTYVSGLTSARARSLVGGIIGIVSVVIGFRVRSRRNAIQDKTKIWRKVALALGVLAVVLSVIHLAGNTGAFGTGGGKAGAIVALVLGICGMIVNGVALRAETKLK